MKRTFALIVLAGSLLASCQMADKDLSGNTKKVFIGSIEPETRTSLAPSGDGYVLNWNAGDRIMVSNGTETAVYQTAAEGTTVAEFTPVAEPLSGTEFTACYPESLFEGQLPAVQYYVEDNINLMPMLAKSGADASHLTFSPACGIIKFNISTSLSGIALSAIQITANQALSGTVVINDGNLSVAQGSGMTLSCGEGVAINETPKAFHMYLPVGSYSELQIRLIATDGKEFSSELYYAQVYNVIRGEMNTINITANEFGEPVGMRDAVLLSGSDVNELMKQLSNPAAKCTSSDATIKVIAFETGTVEKGDVLISEPDAEPVWASLDKASGRLAIRTRASKIYANSNSAYLFSRLHALTGFEGLDKLDTSNTEYFNGMFFSNASANPALTELDLSSFDTGLAVSFTSMFDSLVNLRTLNISSFNTQYSRSFASMFNHCKSLENLDLTHFSTENCETMAGMFRYCTAMTEIDLHTWDMSSVSSVARMFQYCTSLRKLDLSGDYCNTLSLTTANHFINASNEIREMRLGKYFLLENFSAYPDLFWQGKTYLKATVDDPFVVLCAPMFCQRSLRGSEQALYHTNERILVWKNIETGEPLEFDQEIGSLTPTVTVKGCEEPDVVFEAEEGGFVSALYKATTYSDYGNPVVKLMANTVYEGMLDLTNDNGKPFKLDLNGHILESSVSELISTKGTLIITDSGATKGKITSPESMIISITTAGTSVTLDGCVIESTKEKGSAWNSDAAINLAASSAMLTINNSKVYTTHKLSTIRAYSGTLTINDSEISSGTESEGWYTILGLNNATVTVNSGSLYTSGTGNSSTFHIGNSAATMTVNGGYFHSLGRTVSGGNTYISRITLNGGYYDREYSTPSSGGAVTYGNGKSLVALDPAVTHLHETTGETYAYGFVVK